MNQKIKDRIYQINQKELPYGYENTSFGLFPIDWQKKKKLGDLGIWGKGNGIPGEKMISEGVPCVGYGDIYMKLSFHFEKAKSFTDEETAQYSQPIEAGTLLFTATGETAEEIGKCVCYNGSEIIYAGGDIILFNPKDVNPLFLAYQQYQSFSLKEKASFGQGHSVVHIHKENLAKLSVAYPEDKNEQAKIAKILMKWDEVIELQEAYIAKLEIRKKALMQSLLTPKKGWTKKRLNEIGQISGSSVDKKIYEDEKIVDLLNYMDVYRHSKIDETFNEYMSVSATNRQINDYSLKYGDVLITPTSETAEDIGHSAVYYCNRDALYSYHLVRLRMDNNIDCLYRAFMLQADYVRKQFSKKAVGPIRFVISTEQFGLCEIFIPPKPEQVKIANVLNNCEIEISLQKQKLNKLIQQRKSMQQLLLTGIVRVKNEW